MSSRALIAGLVAAALALGSIIVDGIRRQAFGWER